MKSWNFVSLRLAHALLHILKAVQKKEKTVIIFGD